MSSVVGFAFWGVAVTPVGKRVFLLVVAVTPNAMRCMTTTAATVQKAAVGRKKSPPLAVKKQQFVYSIYMTTTNRKQGNHFLYRRSRTFFTANGGLFVFAAFQPAIRQARLGVVGNIREFALDILPDTHDAKGKALKSHKSFCIFLCEYIQRISKRTRHT